MIQAICAISENLCLGRNGHMPWQCKEDLAFFYNTTYGHPVAMGRNTFEAIGQPLPGRTNYVLTHRNISCGDINPFQDKQTILNLTDDCFIIGGRSIWQMFKNDIKRWYITRIPGKYDGDVFFDLSLLDGFSKTETISLNNEIAVCVYERNR